jgi:hypothetical protein
VTVVFWKLRFKWHVARYANERIGLAAGSNITAVVLLAADAALTDLGGPQAMKKSNYTPESAATHCIDKALTRLQEHDS